MTDVRPSSLTQDPWDEIARAAQAAADAVDAEDAVREFVHTALRITGDAGAHEKPGALKPGERHFSVGGAFMVSPDGTSHFLIGGAFR